MKTKAMFPCAAFILLLMPAFYLACPKSLAYDKTQEQDNQQKKDESAKKLKDQPAANYPLTDAQKQAIEGILAESKKKAGPAALRVAGIAKQVYDNLLSDNPSEERANQLRAQMKEAVGEILAIRGDAMREAVKVLSKEQKQLLKTELAKPGAPGELIELIVKDFKITEK